MTRLLAALSAALALIWGFGQIVRDATLPGQIAFYIPTPLVVLALLAVGLLARARGRRGAAALAAAAALVPLTFLLVVEHRWLPRDPAPEGGALRVVHWNVRKGRAWDRALPFAVAERADLYAISEPPWGRRESEIAEALGFPGKPLQLGQVALLARGRLGEPEWLSKGALEVTLVPWEYQGTTWTVMVVDLVSDVRVPRHPHLSRLRVLVEERHPDLILGDLNAPRRSRALSPPPDGFVHAYDAAGRGWSATWPSPLPLWSIDQCLAGPRLRVTAYRLRNTVASDHRMQVVDLAPRYDGATGR